MAGLLLSGGAGTKLRRPEGMGACWVGARQVCALRAMVIHSPEKIKARCWPDAAIPPPNHRIGRKPAFYFFDASHAIFRLYYQHLVGLIRLGFLDGGGAMTFRNDETISCAECGRPFPFTYEQQRRARENHKRPPRYCRECQAAISSERRSSQFDHPARGVPDWGMTTSLPTTPTTPPEQKQDRGAVDDRHSISTNSSCSTSNRCPPGPPICNVSSFS